MPPSGPQHQYPCHRGPLVFLGCAFGRRHEYQAEAAATGLRDKAGDLLARGGGFRNATLRHGGGKRKAALWSFKSLAPARNRSPGGMALRPKRHSPENAYPSDGEFRLQIGSRTTGGES